MKAFLSMILLLGLLTACAQAPAPESTNLQAQADATPVFINELHYDNDGSDVGEAVEIAGLAGTDLTGWSLVAYNGSGGAPYNTVPLSGTLPDEGSGFGTLAYGVNGLQNGAPDGVALVGADGVVRQFLSYEGAFTASGGPADGLTSSDIGVSEGSSTPTGFSLQLTGTGGTYDAFTWAGPAAASFGKVNDRQTFVFAGNAPILTNCATPVFVNAGEAASQTVSAADADGTVTSVALTNIEPAADGVTLTDVSPATEPGGAATATLQFADTLSDSSYSVTLTFSTNDAEPQTADCTLVVNVVQAVKIHDIQGSGDTSPLEGRVVTVTGVVVGDFQANDGDALDTDLDGFYVQEEDEDADADPATSEGVFVYAPDAADVAQGDLVTLTGEVTEFKGLTEVTNLTGLQILGTAPLPTPTPVTLPVASEAGLERFEGMYVVFPQPLVISEYFNFDRFGEIVLSLPLPESEGRVFQPTSYLDPDTQKAAIANVQNLIERSRITLDDGRAAQNPDPARHPNGAVFSLNNRFRGGDVVQNATGVLEYRFDTYRVQPTTGADYREENPRPAAPDDVGGTLKVASFNVLNYFLTLDEGQNSCGPAQNQECRGADDAEELERQRAKIVSALSVLDADAFGLTELENTPGVEPLQDLVTGLNELAGTDTYAFIDTGTIGTDAIRVGILYKPAAVTPLGSYAVLDSADDPRFVDTKNRPALAQTFVGADGGVFTLVVNHFKSKGSGCGAGDDDPLQGSCNLTREQRGGGARRLVGDRPHPQRRPGRAPHRRPQLLRRRRPYRRAARGCGRHARHRGRLYRPRANLRRRIRVLVLVRRAVRLLGLRAGEHLLGYPSQRHDDLAHQRRRTRHFRLRHLIQESGSGRAL